MEFAGWVNGGSVVAAGVVEIAAVPALELVAERPEAAWERLDTAFSTFLTGIHARGADGTACCELLMVSEPADRQLYLAQPHVYVVVRKVAAEPMAARSFVDETLSDLMATLQLLGFVSRRVPEDDLAFERLLCQVRPERTYALAREERTVQVMASVLYHTTPVDADAMRNIAVLANAITAHPHAAISLSLVPTTLAQGEVALVEQQRMQVDAMRRNLMMTPGMTSPTAYIEASQSYQDFLAKAREPQFLCAPVVWAPETSASALLTAVERYLCAADGTGALSQVDCGTSISAPARDFLTKPWQASDALVFQLRNAQFWQRFAPLQPLMRLRQLVPLSFAKAMVRLPVDDGTVVGLASRRANSAREQLDPAILSPDSFRFGAIMDTGSDRSGGEGSLSAGVPLKRFSQHGMIVGMPGYGKTNFVHTMLLRLSERGIPFFAIEPTKSEYRCLVEAIPDLLVFTPGNNRVSPFFINPFIPPRGCTVESYIPSLMDAFETAFTLPDPLPSILRQVVNSTYNRYGWRMDSTSDDPHAKPFGFHELILAFQEHVEHMDYEGEVRNNINTAGVLRLSSLIEQNANIYDTTSTIPIEELLSRPVVLELNAITSKEEKTLLMALILIDICLYTKFNGSFGGDLQNVLLIDEAHVLFGDAQGADGRNHAADALEDMIREIRAYGTGVFVADQHPGTFGPGIIGCTDNKIMFHLVDQQSRQILQDAASLSDQHLDELGHLGMGECLFHCGLLGEPIKLKADWAHALAQYPDNVSDAALAQRGAFWEAHGDLLMPHPACSECTTCRERGCDLALRAEAEYLATRLANHYRRYTQSDQQLLAFVAQRAERDVAHLLDERGIREDRERAGYCVLMRFMRRTLRDNKHHLGNADLMRCHRTFAHFSYATDAADVEAAPEEA